MNPDVLQVLKLRQAALRVTGAKLERGLDLTRVDSRLRDLFTYHQAHTGRWSSRRMQLHNLPRDLGVDFERVLADGTLASVDAEAQRLGCSADDVLACMIRPTLVADDHFLIADYAQVELRCVAWMSDDANLLAALASDPYAGLAARLRIPRQLAKVITLGCIYGMSSRKFAEYCELRQIDLGNLSAEDAVRGFRETYPGVVKLWRDFDDAAKRAIAGECTPVGRCTFGQSGDAMTIRLPSGRTIYYRHCRIEERPSKWDGRLRDTIVYEGPNGERVTYGSSLVENCLAGDTLVYTDAGLLPIVAVKRHHKLWDGRDWVSHDGVTYNGIQEVGTCLGISLTANHLIFDGNSWSSAIRSDARFLRRSLEWAQSSAFFESSSLPLVNAPSQDAYVDGVGIARTFLIPDFGGAARNVANVPLGTDDPRPKPSLFRTDAYGMIGRIGIPGSSADATTPTAPLTGTTAVAESGWMTNGGMTESPSCDMQSLSRDGMSRGSISTDERTTSATSQAISGWLLEVRIPSIAAGLAYSDTEESTILSPSSDSDSRLHGSGERSSTILGSDDLSTGLFKDTRRREHVFDILNCGPESRFAIHTDRGMIVVHNCSQATCRDLLADALIRCEAAGLRPVAHVHDELVCDSSPERLGELESIMTDGPSWAKGLPIKVEAHVSRRYAK